MKKQSLAIFAVSLLVGILIPQKAEGQAFGRILNQAKKAVKERVEGAVKREKESLEQDVKQGAQKLLDDAVERAQDGVAKGLNSVAGATGSSSAEESDNRGGLSGSNTVNINGPKVYVSQTGGSVRGTGAQDSPYKDLQKAIDNAAEGSVICVAEGNYLGKLDCGYIEIKK